MLMTTYSKKSILIIDDDTWMQKLLSKIFAKMDINSVHLTVNGFEGINLAIEKKPDVIFLDLMMPEIDGLLVLKLLKTINCTKDIPILIITGSSDYETLATVLSYGATEFVAKPFTYTTIMEKLDNIFVHLNNDDDEIHNFQEDNFIIDEEHDDFDFFKKFDINVAENDANSVTQTHKESDNLKNKYKKYTSGSTDEIKKILKG